MPTRSLERWINDGEGLKERLEAADCTVDLQYADNKTDQQISQIQNQVAGGSKILVVAAVDGQVLAPVLAEAKKKGETGSSMSTLGLGHIPPVLGELGGVACRSIMRRRLLSFSALRQLRFGGTTEQDVACRALLAAYALLGMALSDRELHLRANCHLVESDEPTVTLDLRYGKSRALAPITDEVAVQVFEAALAHADSVAGVEWNGQTIQLVGDPAILGAASTDDVEV